MLPWIICRYLLLIGDLYVSSDDLLGGYRLQWSRVAALWRDARAQGGSQPLGGFEVTAYSHACVCMQIARESQTNSAICDALFLLFKTMPLSDKSGVYI